MDDKHFPALYRSANTYSLSSQTMFFRVLRSHLILLVLAAALSLLNSAEWWMATLQVLFLLGALGCSIYLFTKRPDQAWYAGRAVAESIKTSTWRYVCRAEPFLVDDSVARDGFKKRLKEIVDQNQEVIGALTEYLSGSQISPEMDALRGESLSKRQASYAKHRVEDQLVWYAGKAAYNKKRSKAFFWGLVSINGLAVLCAVLRVKFGTVPWPTDICVAAAASVLTWMQARRFSELASSYALAAFEIGIVKDEVMLANTDQDFSVFVGDAENAFSREHTQWVARKDV
jgi:hypothetical protein